MSALVCEFDACPDHRGPCIWWAAGMTSDEIAAACNERHGLGWRCTRFANHPGDHQQVGGPRWSRRD